LTYCKQKKRHLAKNKLITSGGLFNQPPAGYTILLTQANRWHKDIGDFRKAVSAAESIEQPSRVKLYDLYTTALLDTHLTSVLAKRKAGILWVEFPDLLPVGEKRDLGNLMNGLPWALYKTGAAGDWTQYAELFGQPIREYVYNGAIEEERLRVLKDAQEDTGGSATYIHSSDSTKNILSQGMTGNGELYEKFVAVCSESEAFAFNRAFMEYLARRIWGDKLYFQNDIDRGAWKAFLDTFNDTVEKGSGPVEETDPLRPFTEELRYHNGVFSAFRAHAMQKEIAGQLLDADGNLKPFDQFRKDVVKFVESRWLDGWLRTEYDTAVLRANLARQWKSLLPNSPTIA
jgi:hypothetical protein